MNRLAGRSLAPLVAALLTAGGCAPATDPAPKVDGQKIVPIDPTLPGDSLFQEGLALYVAAEGKQLGDPAGASADYLAAQAKFDLLRSDPALCPAPSIRCDNAAYLAGRSSYELGTMPLPNDPVWLEDARARLDAMLADFPASPFADNAAYFDARAHFGLAALGAGSYADAEVLFERILAERPSGTYADNALYYDGRCEFERGMGALATFVDPTATPTEYALARGWFDEAIAALGSLETRFPTSSYWDNAAYYRGRSFLEKPTPGGTADTERDANLAAAISTLTPVVAATTSSYYAEARYWRGRSHYSLSFHRALATDKITELDAAAVDFHAVPATSLYRDNALGYAVKALARKIDFATALGDATAAATAGATACGDYGTLQADFAISTWTATAATTLCPYVTAGTLTCAALTCP